MTFQALSYLGVTWAQALNWVGSKGDRTVVESFLQAVSLPEPKALDELKRDILIVCTSLKIVAQEDPI
jgi:hypothetical protein